MPTIDISNVDWAEVGPDLYLLLKDIEEYLWDITDGGTLEEHSALRYVEKIRKALARVEGEKS